MKFFSQILGRLQEFAQFHEKTNQHQLKTFDQSQSDQFFRKFMNVSSYSNYANLLKKNLYTPLRNQVFDKDIQQPQSSWKLEMKSNVQWIKVK